MTRTVVVTCAEHGEMDRDQPRFLWRCPAERCGAWLPDAEVCRLVAGRPPGDDPVRIAVT